MYIFTRLLDRDWTECETKKLKMPYLSIVKKVISHIEHAHCFITPEDREDVESRETADQFRDALVLEELPHDRYYEVITQTAGGNIPLSVNVFTVTSDPLSTATENAGFTGQYIQPSSATQRPPRLPPPRPHRKVAGKSKTALRRSKSLRLGACQHPGGAIWDDKPCDPRPRSNSCPESGARGFSGCATTSASVNGSSSAYRSDQFRFESFAWSCVGEADRVFAVSPSRMGRSVFAATAEDGVTSIRESTGFHTGGGDYLTVKESRQL